MRQLEFPTVFSMFTLALLGAAFAGCASGTVGPEGGSHSSGGGDTGATGPGEDVPGGEDPGNDIPGGAGGSSSTTSPGDNGDGNGGSNGGGNAGDGGGNGGGNAGDGPDPGGDAYGSGIFEAPNAWTKKIGALPKNPESDAIIAWLDQAGGWGSGLMKIDFGMHVLTADAATPKKEFFPTQDFFSPDCDKVPVPLPPGGALEGELGYTCLGDGDCHLIVHHTGEKKLYEMWRANIQGNVFLGGCLAVWDLTKTYPDDLRGEGCTSADAGGFPIAAMVWTPEEVAAGVIDHAVRFILPNARIRKNVYVHPGTHSTNATSGGPDAPPYGVRFRLRKDFPLETLPSDGARVVAKALQEYGMFLADGGTIALSTTSDVHSNVKWQDLGIDSHSLTALQVTDMEVVDMGPPIEWSGECNRNPW